MACFYGGCCFGIRVDSSHPLYPLAVIYPPRFDRYTHVAAPAGVPLLAVPAIEAVGNAVIAAIVFAFGLISYRRGKAVPGQTAALYGALYALWRFTLEFLRGDAARGLYAGFSTSQYVSMGIFAAAIAVFAGGKAYKKRRG